MPKSPMLDLKRWQDYVNRHGDGEDRQEGSSEGWEFCCRKVRCRMLDK